MTQSKHIRAYTSQPEAMFSALNYFYSMHIKSHKVTFLQYCTGKRRLGIKPQARHVGFLDRGPGTHPPISWPIRGLLFVSYLQVAARRIATTRARGTAGPRGAAAKGRERAAAEEEEEGAGDEAPRGGAEPGLEAHAERARHLGGRRLAEPPRGALRGCQRIVEIGPLGLRPRGLPAMRPFSFSID